MEIQKKQNPKTKEQKSQMPETDGEKMNKNITFFLKFQSFMVGKVAGHVTL
jgi:hypothetical protein